MKRLGFLSMLLTSIYCFAGSGVSVVEEKPIVQPIGDPIYMNGEGPVETFADQQRQAAAEQRQLKYERTPLNQQKLENARNRNAMRIRGSGYRGKTGGCSSCRK